MRTIEEAAKLFWYEQSTGISDVDHESIFRNGAEFVQRWISVEEELPVCNRDLTLFRTKVSNPVIVKYDNGQYEIAVLSENNWYNSQGQRIYKPTHWRPIEIK